jgi:hypothetical protein
MQTAAFRSRTVVESALVTGGRARGIAHWAVVLAVLSTLAFISGALTRWVFAKELLIVAACALIEVVPVRGRHNLCAVNIGPAQPYRPNEADREHDIGRAVVYASAVRRSQQLVRGGRAGGGRYNLNAANAFRVGPHVNGMYLNGRRQIGLQAKRAH